MNISIVFQHLLIIITKFTTRYKKSNVPHSVKLSLLPLRYILAYPSPLALRPHNRQLLRLLIIFYIQLSNRASHFGGLTFSSYICKRLLSF